MTVVMDAYRFAAAGGGGTTTYFEEDFTATTSGDLNTDNATTNEVGNPPSGSNGSRFDYEGDGSGIQCTVTFLSQNAFWETSGREDVQVTWGAVLAEGATGGGNVRWQGMGVRAASSTDTDALTVIFQDAGPDLVLVDGDYAGSLLKTWDLSALLTTPPVDGDTVELVIRCDGNDITFYSIQVNGGSVEVVDDTHTLTGGAATAHGSGSGADWYGIISNEAVSSSGERFTYFKVESIPA